VPVSRDPVIAGREDLQQAYRDEAVARQYVEQRFTTPLGALLHSRQVRVVQDLVRAAGVKQVLEIAPGPARLTVDVAPLVERAVVLDASLQMLGEAKRRLAGVGLLSRVSAVQADAFALPISGAFELAYSFRLIRHFERPDRLRLYQQIARVLKTNGKLVFDAVNRVVSEPLRAGARSDEHRHYDALLTPDEIREELRESGFVLESLTGVHHRFKTLLACQVYVAPRSARLARSLMNIVEKSGGAPLEWIVVCRRA
jgi:ubiquinone/menaquinone biosynthesis C-methylase UbiE